RAFYYDLGSTEWVSWLSSPSLSADLGATLIGSPGGERLFYLSATKVPIFVDVATGVETRAGSSPFGTQQAGPCAGFDSRRGRWVVFFERLNSPPEVLVIDVNWSQSTWSY